ncbi:alpha-lytic protease prodomain-containing protein [Sphaerisporangium flaviroseum]|uniref:Alpha-lytic protease prodomain-containing protein n=1 Tax=Sphaerisporangium flaviroseum TaxID=509199 RepID=A0ABP7IYK0_9ACTN
MLRRRTVTAGCALAISALTLMTAPAIAEREPAGATGTSALKPPPGMVEAMQRDLDITAEQAESRLLNEARLGGVEVQVRKKLTGTFAGSWLSGPTSATLTVATTDASAASAITGSGVQAKVVARTLGALDAAKQTLDQAAAQAPASTPVWYVDVRTNSVVVLSSQPAEAESFIAASGVDRAAVRVEQSSERPQTYYDVRGGDAYYIGSSRCSVGFSVTRGTQGGFVSAGHCGSTGSSTSGFNRVAQGSFQGSSFPTNDYSWIAVNTNWTPQPWVNNGSGGNVNVSGSTVAVEGASICRSGSTTGWHCGTVQQRNTSVTYSQGTVYEVTRTSVCAEPGDSGGSFISGSQAQGVTSGGSGNCSSGGTTYFQPVNEILSVYGLTLRTSGTTPPPTGCSGSQQSFTGSLTSGASAYQPNNSYYQSTVSGTHTGCLDGPNGVDFDLYLQQWNGSAWVNVASGTSSGPDETVSYSGAAGYYRYRVHAYSGSGSYTLGLSRP